METAVQPNQLWRSNDDRAPRTVRVISTDYRWAHVRNVETNRGSQMELSRFARNGRTGWTYVGDANTPLPAEPTVRVGQTYQDRYEERHGRDRYLQVTVVNGDRAECDSWYREPNSPIRTTNLACGTLLGPGYRLVSEPADAFYACPEPDCTEPRSEPGECPVHEIPLLHIGPDGHEVTT